MSTRAVIAKPAGDGWRGRYHHWDGYPTGLGRTLHDAYTKVFDGDLDTLVRRLIDDEPVGWSTINGYDLTKPSEYALHEHGQNHLHGPQSFSARGETSDSPTGDWITHDGPDCGTEWCYVLTANGICVLERRFGSPDNDQGHGMGMFGFGASDTKSGGYWAEVGFVRWDETPDWEGLERGAELSQ